jgi:hypothetical protein
MKRAEKLFCIFPLYWFGNKIRAGQKLFVYEAQIIFHLSTINF